jgi:glycosyltransferase involved in cell wall biosynthesis
MVGLPLILGCECMARVSVVIPTYNRCQLLPRAIKSAQLAGTDVEIIVVDDASTDDTPKVCRLLEDIRYLRMEKNVGQAAARNAGIQLSRSEYIAFLDDDDVRLQASLDSQIEALAAAPEAAFVYGRVLRGDTHGKSTGKFYYDKTPSGDIFINLILWAFIPIISVVFRKKHLMEAGLFEPSLKGNSEDWDLLLRITEKHLVVGIEEPVAIYRMATPTSNQATSDKANMKRAGKNVQERALALPRIANAPSVYQRQVRKMIRDYEADIAIWTANDHLANHEPHIARSLLLSAIKNSTLRSIRPWTLQLLAKSLFSSCVSLDK